MGVQLTFDHAVHFVNKPEQAPEELAGLGIHTVNGGRHESVGTYNALTYFDLRYIEWIGIFDPKLLPPHQDTQRYGLVDTLAGDDYVEGLSRIALRTEQIDELAEQLAAEGNQVIGPVDCSRRRPDGKLLEWKLLFAGLPDEGLPLPFFIQWNDSDEDRRADLTANGTITDHARGPITLDYVAFTVHDLGKTVTRWTKWLHLEAEEAVYDDYWKGKKQVIDLGSFQLVFLEPDQEGPAREYLQSRGERPFLVGLSSGQEGSPEQYVNIHGSFYHLK
ncbi:VOC family protein [Paenibacillus sp. OAE614]|uniref:VOC family protein n=1 Tax=Paenibacillus sp. OAE614 TaxID=2663804 RepID=UPI0017893321